ncbi:glycoside hydrolase family 16 protein [Nocardiopsis sp. NPDC006198]|uniref:Glycoside hydrolase family 16 protein n=1 Tax=Streptomonospora nanhaiensis TaxID=1323731 RepID=A0ABY6YM85_9ACTN|nr:glycoside hydrolase family 16 protein [Streptomonospora nanhaiensis]WAE73467.1 glycoside hydrolase family 16 protein [Streptomonospora nanhaiensis]
MPVPLRFGGIALACAVTLPLAACATGSPVQVETVSDRTSTTSAPCGLFFDDFDYGDHTDPALRAQGWNVRSWDGGPGVPGASWDADNVSFAQEGGNSVLRLTSTTDGTPAGTSQAELTFGEEKFHEGTYAAMVKFADAPVSGQDGDTVLQTFYTITPLAYDNDPDYSELDFEYLPNSGWGAPAEAMYLTSYHTYQRDPWVADNVSDVVNRSFEGWRDLVIQVEDGVVRYYVDTHLVAEHSGKYYPSSPMSINFNQWFIDMTGHVGGPSTYVQDVDWVYHQQGESVAPEEVNRRVGEQRNAGVSRVDGVVLGGGC